MKEFKKQSSNLLSKIKKLNRHTHIKVTTQFLRLVFILLFSLFYIACISYHDNNKNAEKQCQLQQEINTTTKQLKTTIKDKEKYILEYKSVMYSNKEQENTIEQLEEKVAELQKRNYELTHPQKRFNYTAEELEWLAKLAYHEAGCSSCPDRQQQLVVAVVLRRVASPLWPNSIKEVISQSGQYGSYNTWDWNNNAVPQRAYDNALAVLNGICDYPDNLIFQSSFPQKSWGAKEYSIYETYYTKETGTTTYFCLGE